MWLVSVNAGQAQSYFHSSIYMCMKCQSSLGPRCKSTTSTWLNKRVTERLMSGRVYVGEDSENHLNTW